MNRTVSATAGRCPPCGGVGSPCRPRSLARLARGAAAGFAGGLLLLLAGVAPAAAQVLDAAWEGRQQAAQFFQASLEKERKPADWAAAIRELEKCVELSPEPSWEASIQDGSGRWRRHYLPYYYMGRAWWGQGDCDRAVEWLSTSLAKGEVCKSKQGDARELEKLLVKCEQRGVAPAQAARDLVRSECAKVQTASLGDGFLPALDRLLAEGWWSTRLDLPVEHEAR